MNEYPVGTTWTASNDIGTATICISTQYFGMYHRPIKVYTWEFVYSDGSGYCSDWTNTYQRAREEVMGKLHDGTGKYPRMKRIK